MRRSLFLLAWVVLVPALAFAQASAGSRCSTIPSSMAAAAAGPSAEAGVNDPTGATAELGRRLIEYKVAAAVDQIRTLMKGATPAAPK